jgi:uncharacterized BrkB/YihY/UPF0761 family membrane protein
MSDAPFHFGKQSYGETANEVIAEALGDMDKTGPGTLGVLAIAVAVLELAQAVGAVAEELNRIGGRS